MKALRMFALTLLPLLSQPLWASDRTEAVIGGAIGGALGAAVGAEVGGREGAIVGAGVGAAVGTAITTKEHESQPPVRTVEPRRVEIEYREERPKDTFCPPGQAKKGRC